jgi:hypothetical protein
MSFASSASFLDLYLEFDDSGQLSTKTYDKRDDFSFKIINFPNTVDIHWNVHLKVEHFDDVSFLLLELCFFFLNNYPINQGIYIYVGHFVWNKVNLWSLILLICFLVLSGE